MLQLTHYLHMQVVELCVLILYWVGMVCGVCGGCVVCVEGVEGVWRVWYVWCVEGVCIYGVCCVCVCVYLPTLSLFLPMLPALVVVGSA